MSQTDFADDDGNERARCRWVAGCLKESSPSPSALPTEGWAPFKVKDASFLVGDELYSSGSAGCWQSVRLFFFF